MASTWATELASHGAIVVALDHPFDAAATRILDGAIAMSGLVATGDATEDNRNAASWTETRAKDLSALLDALVAAKQHSPVLVGADMDRVVVVGHSLGGAAALLAGGTDLRVDGVVDIDGMPRSPVSSRRIPTAIIVAGDMDSNPPYERSVAAFVAAGAVRVTVAGIAHLGFTDASHIIAPIPGVTGSQARSGPAMAAKVTLVVVTAVSNKADVSSSSFASLATHDVTALQLDDWLAGSP